MAARALVALAFVFVVGCSSESPPTAVSPDDAADTTDPAAVAAPSDRGDPTEPHPSDHIFDQDRLHTFELTLTEEALAEIDSDPTAEQYVEGSLTFEGQTIEPVGIRYKGSVGAFVFCVAGSTTGNPFGLYGEKTCPKLSMKVKINWEDPDDEFFGLRRLQFHSQNLDPSQLHERLGYWLFREMGVPAPRSVHARLVVNGEYVGLFALTEQIDGRFTRYNFGDGTGNLYKEVWPLTGHGNPPDRRVITESLRTNEDENPSLDLFQQFGEEMRDDGPAAIDRWVDVEETLALVAVDRTIRNDDGPFHWYCIDFPCSPHNFFWYEDPTAERFHLIPWDLDNAFENIEFQRNPVITIADEWGEITADCDQFPYGGFGLDQRSAACDPLVAALVTRDVEYEAALDRLVNGPLSQARVDAVLDQWADQIAAATAEAAEAHPDAISVDEWEDAVDELRSQLDHARQR